MLQKEMEVVVEEFIAQSRHLLIEKAKDYASEGDRLRNFKNVAQRHGVTAEQVALIYMDKHMDAISNMVARGDYSWSWQKPDGSEGAKSRISDTINYLLLLAAIMEEREQKKVPGAI